LRGLFVLILFLGIARPSASQNLLQNGTFDSGTAPWNSGTFSTLDSLNLPNSGSIKITSTLSAFNLESSFSECIPVTQGKSYQVQFDYRMVAPAGITGVADASIHWYGAPGCASFLGLSFSTQGDTVDGAWHTVVSTSPLLVPPVGAQGMQLSIGVAKLQDSGTITANFDNVVLKEAGTCGPTPAVLCLNNNRFQVEATWQTASGSGAARVVKLTDDTGYLWFFSPDNVETVVKILDACSFNSTFWVFAGGLTDQGVEMKIVDTKTGTTNVYQNTRGVPFAPIQDTSAFATCP
jgi:hypothetical protein